MDACVLLVNVSHKVLDLMSFKIDEHQHNIINKIDLARERGYLLVRSVNTWPSKFRTAS